eukprot:TRINITY_DN52442_c0_g1_i2.p1 TRINITY_DN52442_c0_g1~~TRINITY_DN52442_c0_g1_i2.p1  ORF type:complete len:174 (-),score=39.63 TRINITY_DN52442_c0_g1_i2:239-688(-)
MQRLMPNPARSGNGTVDMVGIRMSGTFRCQECIQRYDSERALVMHVKFTHGNKVVRAILLHADATSDGDLVGTTFTGEELFRFPGAGAAAATKAGALRAGIAELLSVHEVQVTLLRDEEELQDDVLVDDPASIIVKQDMGRDAEHMFAE